MDLEWRQDPENKERLPVRFAAKDWTTLCILLALAALVIFGFKDSNWTLPGIGLTFVVFCFAGLSLFLLRGQPHKSREAFFLLASGLALSITYGVYANDEMRLLNLLPMAAALLLALYALSAGVDGLPAGPWGVARAAGRAVSDGFRHMDKPFRAVPGLWQDRPRQLKGLGLGLLIATPLLFVSLALLSAADEVFGAGVAGLLNGFHIPADFLKKGIGSLLLGLCLFSLLWGIRHARPASASHTQATLPALSAAVVLGLLAAVYAAFVWVQLSYLFGGQLSAAMAGGWAQYARKGFFELAAISALNVSVLALTLSSTGAGVLERSLGSVLIALTFLILLSAARRMALYIEVYGLSLLRLLTLWAMLMIFAALVGFAVRVIRPHILLFRPLAAFFLAAWVAFNAIGPAALVARWNVDEWEQGGLATVDTMYLASLGTDALPALLRLKNNGQNVEPDVWSLKARREAPWWAWSLSELYWVNVP